MTEDEVPPPVLRRLMAITEAQERLAREFDRRLRSQERQYYARLIEVFGIFVAIFALLAVGGNTAVRVSERATAAEGFWVVAATLAPFVGAILVLLLAVALLTGQVQVRRRRP